MTYHVSLNPWYHLVSKDALLLLRGITSFFVIYRSWHKVTYLRKTLIPLHCPNNCYLNHYSFAWNTHLCKDLGTGSITNAKSRHFGYLDSWQYTLYYCTYQQLHLGDTLYPPHTHTSKWYFPHRHIIWAWIWIEGPWIYTSIPSNTNSTHCFIRRLGRWVGFHHHGTITPLNCSLPDTQL